MLYLLSFIIIIMITIYVITFTYRAKSLLSEMTAMMIAMAISMMTSLVVGTILGIILIGRLTIPVIFSVLFGMLIGYLIGRPFSLLASLDGLLAGIMGGMMGAMLGVMVFTQDPVVMTIFVDVIFIIIMMLIVKLIRQAVQESEIKPFTFKKNNWVKTIIGMIALLLIVSVVFFKPISYYFNDLFGSTSEVSEVSSEKTNEVQAEQKDGYQEAVIKVEPYGYTPENVKVKVGVPVKLHFQKSFAGGCLSFLLIEDFQLEKTLKKGDNLVEFTPEKPGIYTFHCGMNMYFGKILVE
ncbi:cupredoxin domain-containing protein [Lysinibacillus fusiformis]|uniref:cupredoxin domain-containing protein n=1 Tax=Lysinibacillus fusiformis TaxID=28031 RepID=UPI003D0255F6